MNATFLFESIEGSKLYARLEKLEVEERAASKKKGGDVAQLMLNVKAVITNAEEISKHVISYMPQYTLHDGKHLWNVLSYAEELAGESIDELNALECALLLMAVFVHDLGMVPSEVDVMAWEDPEGKSPEAEAWQTFCAGHPLWAQYERLSVEKVRERAKLLGKVRAEYLRVTHADEAKPLGGVNRIYQWLERLEGFDPKLLEHRGLSYREPLALLAMSHGQAVDWLPERLTRCAEVSIAADEVYHHDVGGGEVVNWPYLSWLLRLADIMDFDASRTPRVVFEHLGIDDAVSVQEWQKHLAITSVTFVKEGEVTKVRYVSNKCPSPRVEKAILEFIGWINQELDHVEMEQARGCRHYAGRKDKLRLKLPDKAEVKINAREGKYEYLDVSFTLERDAVMELLMGEALYGDHNLALRELVQNALDALHLRDMRSQLREKLKGTGRINDAPPVEPVGASEKLEVHVTWGHDAHGRAWIKVKDNGVGMTKGQIEKFLTRIGKSYYKSPEFKREQKLMKEHGLLCTTISQFGIGFLSSFMLADKVEVVTRAGGHGGDDEHARRVVVDGPHGMIAIYPVTGGEGGVVTGTEVTLWLKEEFKLVEWDRDAVLRGLRFDFYGIGGSVLKAKFVNPALELGRFVMWPLYPVHLRDTKGSDDVLVLDSDFHFRELVALDPEAVRQKAKEWAVPPNDLSGLAWDFGDWVDLDGTGSRMRIAVPRTGAASRDLDEWLNRPNKVNQRLAQSLLQSFVEPQLPEKGRLQLLVNGICIPGIHAMPQLPGLEAGVGSICWVDMRGEAAPRLRTDRMAPTRHQPKDSKVLAIHTLQKAKLALRPSTLDVWRWLGHAVVGLKGCKFKVPNCSSWLSALGLPADPVLWTACLDQELGATNRSEGAVFLRRDYEVVTNLTHIKDRTLQRSVGCIRGIERAHNLVFFLVHARSQSRQEALRLAQHLGVALDSAKASLLAQVRGPDEIEAFDCFSASHWLSEAFQPSIEEGLSCLALSSEADKLLDLHHVGPMELVAHVVPLPSWLESRQYDLIAPWTGVLVGASRQKRPEQDVVRKARIHYTMPFVLGDPVDQGVRTHGIPFIPGVSDLLLWMPHPRQMGWRFADDKHSLDDWNQGSLSALWDIEQGTVVYAPGLHDRESIRKVGVSLSKLLGIKK